MPEKKKSINPYRQESCSESRTLSDLEKCHVSESLEHQSMAVYRKCHKAGCFIRFPVFIQYRFMVSINDLL